MRLSLPVPVLAAALAGCGAAPPAEVSPAEPEPAFPSSKEGWGAVFWSEGQAWKVGGGLDTIGPRGRAPSTVTDETPGRCGGVAIQGAADRAVLAAPPGVHGDAPAKPAVIAASVVEAAAWRLDEVLPGRDRFTPVDPQASPAAQRGVDVGSVVKLRRYGGPPVLVVGGARAGTGALLVLDREATQVLAQVSVPEMRGTPRVLPPADLDGDGNLETALFTVDHIMLARLTVTPATVSLTPLESWRCPAPPGEG